MKKRVKENKHDFLCFPYKCYFASDEYKNRKSNSLDVDDERTEYYKTLYKKFFPNEFSHIHLGVRYFPLIPLQLLAQRDPDPTVAALSLSLESVFAVIGGAIMLHERMSPRELIGCLVMFIAIILVQIPLPEKKTKKDNA